MPVGALAVLGVPAYLPDTRHARKSFDFFGYAMLAYLADHAARSDSRTTPQLAGATGLRAMELLNQQVTTQAAMIATSMTSNS